MLSAKEVGLKLRGIIHFAFVSCCLTSCSQPIQSVPYRLTSPKVTEVRTPVTPAPQSLPLVTQRPEYPRLTVVDQPEVRHFARHYLGPERSVLEQSMLRREALVDEIKGSFLKRRLPLELLHVPTVESAYRPDARGSGVVGLWQFTSGTAEHYGLNTWFFNDERKDVEKSSEAAAQHFQDLFTAYDDWFLALAAYNAGPGRINNAIKEGNTRDFFALAQRGLIPRTTREYVSRVLGLTLICRAPARYNLNLRCGVDQFAPQN